MLNEEDREMLRKTREIQRESEEICEKIKQTRAARHEEIKTYFLKPGEERYITVRSIDELTGPGLSRPTAEDEKENKDHGHNIPFPKPKVSAKTVFNHLQEAMKNSDPNMSGIYDKNDDSLSLPPLDTPPCSPISFDLTPPPASPPLVQDRPRRIRRRVDFFRRNTTEIIMGEFSCNHAACKKMVDQHFASFSQIAAPFVSL